MVGEITNAKTGLGNSGRPIYQTPSGRKRIKEKSNNDYFLMVIAK